MPIYEVCEHHGEVLPNPNVEEEEKNDWAASDVMHEMLDSLRHRVKPKAQGSSHIRGFEIFKLLKDSEESLHEHTDVSILAFVTRLMVIKSKYFFEQLLQ
jgi:hypothetical protein